MYSNHRRKIDVLNQAEKIIDTLTLGHCSLDDDERYLVLRFKCPLYKKGNNRVAEIYAIHKMIRVVKELLLFMCNNIDTNYIARHFYDLDMINLDTASFLYFFYENAACLQMEERTPPPLGALCVDALRGLKRDKIHILPLRACGNGEYVYYAFSYDNYMLQQAYPSIQFCTHPVHLFEYTYDVSFCLILDLDMFTIFESLARLEQRRFGAPDNTVDLEQNEIIKLEETNGLEAPCCFRTFHELCTQLRTNYPFKADEK